MRFLKALLFLALAGGGAFAAYHAMEYRTLAIEAQAELDEARVLIIRRDAGLPTNRSTRPDIAARAVRDWIYRTSSIGRGTVPSSFGSDIYAALGSVGGEQLCGGLSVAYAWALNMIGIPARIVRLATADFLEGRARFDTHVTVEADFGSGWIVSDPTFNAEFECSDSPGDRTSIQEMRACLDRGEKIVPVQVGTVRPNRTVTEYYLPFSNLLAAFWISGSPPIEYPRQGWLLEAVALYP